MLRYKQRLFIYDRREMLVLVLLTFMIAVFTFTLGVHFGKHVGNRIGGMGMGDTSTIATLPDQIPNRQELTEQGKGAQQALEETLNQELHDEVTRTGIKLDTLRQVDLPHKPKNVKGGATTLGPPADAKADQPEKKAHQGGPANTSSREKYTLQIGSFPTLEEAKKQLTALGQSELKPFLREAEIKGKGKWYRLYSGGFLTRSAAEQAGEKYRSQHMITSFIVAKLSD